MASTIAERRILRRIPKLRTLSSRELENVQERIVHRTYKAGEVIWRTHGPLRFSGYIQSGEIELDYRAGGISVRTTRLHAGDPLPPRALQGHLSHKLVIARALTDVSLGILPEPKSSQLQSAAKGYHQNWMNWLWPVMLLILVAVLARDDILRITSGLFYLAATQGESTGLNNPRSMSLLQAARQVDKNAAFVYNEEGYRWFQQNNLPGAAAAFNEAVTINPANGSALNNMGITYFTQGDLLQADRFLQMAVEQIPDNPTARYNLGITLMQLQDPAGAIREFRETGFIDRDSPWPLLQQAYLYQQIGDFAKAEQNARSAIQQDPNLAPAHLLLGMALYNQGREADALPSFAAASRLDPGNRVAEFYQALILGHQKQYELALPILHRLFFTSTEPAETIRILAEMDALGRLQAESTAAGP